MTCSTEEHKSSDKIEEKFKSLSGAHYDERSGSDRSRTARSSSVRDFGKKWTNLHTPEARMTSIDPVLHWVKCAK